MSHLTGAAALPSSLWQLAQGKLAACLLALLCSGAAQSANAAGPAQPGKPAMLPALPGVSQVLTRVHQCSPSLVLRTQAFSAELEKQTCQRLQQVEARFHQLFGQDGKPRAPVLHDHNHSLRANIYASRADYEKYAPAHFQMPTDNGGMYLEGLPHLPGNQAEFVANQKKDGQVHNLEHEFVHYLDGRFNVYGDFCANLHDSHGAPENCPKPAPLTPYLIWWTEGIAEYVAHGDNYPKAQTALQGAHFALSELFDTGYESNNGTERTYYWGYLATRFMLEKQRSKLDQMLAFTRSGDFPRYQALVKSWGKQMDGEFAQWLQGLPSSAKGQAGPQ
ncbi:collagenase [Massilia sp. W12]|uniref:collagenase n=1 Tax=Massilia sp. W12 TaxID=3126507 RepID=UPI0030D1F030